MKSILSVEPAPSLVDTVWVPSGSVRLEANLALPAAPRGVVLLNHGRSDRRRRARRDVLAEALLKAGFGTFLVDLLTDSEEIFLMSRTDDALGGERLADASRWLAADPRTAALPVGCVGAGPGVPASLVAAARPDARIRALVTHGGRPHDAGAALEALRAPALLVAGGEDREGLRSGQEAAKRMTCKNRLFVIPGITAAFSEHGAREEMSRLSVNWFAEHLPAAGQRSVAKPCGT